MKRIFFLFLIVFILSISTFSSADPNAEPVPTISEKTREMQRFPGFFPFYWDELSGKIFLEIDKPGQEFLYLHSLPAGIGSNDIGLDRGQLGEARLVKFERSGPKILLIQPNYKYRADSDNPDERLAVADAFAQSVIGGFEVVAEEESRILIDASEFFLRDAHNVTGVLKETGQGDYELDLSRSAFYLPHLKNFPRNTEIEVLLTFSSDSPGEYVRQVVPTPGAISVRQRHSLIRLPDNGYETRPFDPRSGLYDLSYMDYASPIAEPVTKKLIYRHRLKKKNPQDEKSEAVEPIIYYVDRGAPEPIRSALIEGASWWNEAFEAIGFQNAFQVKLLPEDADPMDVRYNVIQWVHRSTRGWSYGGWVSDPRSGEIIKGHVLLGSLRVRQDYLIAEGLLAPYEDGKPVSAEMEKMALARIRQLSAHEVGHTLGLQHNFAASTKDRASVMDYPHPLVQIDEDGSFDLSAAYDTGIGEWDKAAIAYAYQDFPGGISESGKLLEIIEAGIAAGLPYISDYDARPAGSAHPSAHLWDNAPDPVGQLRHIMNVRRKALDRFGNNNIKPGAPMSSLENVLTPIYLYHRYQVEATAKLIGGLDYAYALRGDKQTVTEIVPADEQRQALKALLETLRPEVLALPQRILKIIPPQIIGEVRDREIFKTHTGLTFDPFAAAETAANITVDLILNKERAARLLEYHARDMSFAGFKEIVDQLISATWKSVETSKQTGYQAEIQRVINYIVLNRLMSLAADETAANQVRAIAFLKLDQLQAWLSEQVGQTEDESQAAQFLYAIQQIKIFQEDPTRVHLTKPIEAPAGSPIGCQFSTKD